MNEALLALVRALDKGQMTLSRFGPSSYPDPTKTSYNDMVSWRVSLTFGQGYFTGALVTYTGIWGGEHNGTYAYDEISGELPIEDAVKQFLEPSLPDWVK